MSDGVARVMITRAASWLDGMAAIIALALMAMTFVDVLGRYLFNAPLGGAFELTQYGLALLVFTALPQVTVLGEHVRVDLFDHYLPRWFKRAMSMLWAIVIATALGYLAWRLSFMAERLQRYGDSTATLRVPLAPLAWIMCGSSACSALLALCQPFLTDPDTQS
jgi:TRAP-type C4-dicarboxylate transport system permease small subunit